MRFLRYAAVLVTPFLLATTLTAQSLDVQLQRAVQREMATGDTKAAIREYRRIAERAGSNKTVGSQALLRLAEALAKQGDAQARTVYEQIVARYPDQTEAVAVARGRLTAVNRPIARQLARRQIFSDGTSRFIGLATMSVSPDGRFLLFPLNNRTQLIARDLTTGVERVLLRDDTSIHIQPLMSPDGKRIIYGFGRNASDAPGEIRIMNSDTTGQRTVVTLPRSEISRMQMMAWSPDGTRILTRMSTGQGRVQLRWMNVADGAMSPLIEVITSGNFDAEISPDGRYLALGGVTRGDKRELLLLTSDGARTTTLSDSRNDMMPVGWSPDGRNVVVASTRTTSVSLWMFPVTNGALTGDPVQAASDICDCDDFTSYGMTKAGAFYFGATVNRSDVFTVERDPRSGLPTSAQKPVKSARNGRNAWPLWSSNSQQLLYYWASPTSRELSIYTPVTEVERRLSGVGIAAGGACWSNENEVLIRRRQGGRIEFRRVNVDTRAETVLFDEPADAISGSTCTPDGRFVAYRTNLAPSASDTGAATLIMVRDTRTGASSQLRAPIVSTSTPVISHDGAQIAFVGATNASAREISVFVGAASGTDARRVTVPRPAALVFMGSAVPVSWSPDGRFLYYARRERVDAPWEWYVVGIDGGQEQKVGLTGVDARDVSISPDGTKFAFASGPLQRPEIAVIEDFLPAQK